MTQKTATIELIDEVNAKIHGLDTTTRRKLFDKYSFILPHARYTPAYRMGRWDGKVNFFSIGGKTYINLLEDILEILLSEGYEVSVSDKRQRFEINLKEIDVDHFSDRKWPKGHPAEGQPVILREYQKDIINQFVRNHCGVQEVGTGAGKTLVTAALSDLVEKSFSDDEKLLAKIGSGYEIGRTIVIVPNKDLVTQTEADYVNLGLDVGVYYGDRKEYGKTHTICTWQSLEVIQKNYKSGKSDMSLNDFSEGVVGLIVDECFDGDTMILTPDGERKISELKPGDKVINLDEDKKVFKEDTVVELHKNLTKSQSEDMLELEFDNGVKIRVTANHEFMTDVGWVRADQLTEEMEIINIETYQRA